MPEPTVYELLGQAQAKAIEALEAAREEYAEAIERHAENKEDLENGVISAWNFQMSKTKLRRIHANLNRTAHTERLIADALGAANKAPSLH